MESWALFAAVLVAAYLGFALLALSQDRHWHHLVGGRNCPARTVRILRAAGYALLLLGFWLSLVRDGPSFGALLWATTLSVAAFAVVCTLTWRPHWLRPVALLCRRMAPGAR
jgi:hypothetical protein